MTFDHWWDSTASTGSPDTYSGWQESCRQAWEAGQNEEREACAKVCADVQDGYEERGRGYYQFSLGAEKCAEKIRERSNERNSPAA